jgi:hypothetical protein
VGSNPIGATKIPMSCDSWVGWMVEHSVPSIEGITMSVAVVVAPHRTAPRSETTIHLYIATLAPMVEQRFCNPLVVGSNPTGGSNRVGRTVAILWWDKTGCLQALWNKSTLLAGSIGNKPSGQFSLGRLAQRLAHLPYKQRAVGSNPTSTTIVEVRLTLGRHP